MFKKLEEKEEVKCEFPTGFSVLLVFSVESVHSLQQLVLLAAARVIDKVPGKNLFQLADWEVFYRLLIVQIRQRGSDPPLCRRADLQSTKETVVSKPAAATAQQHFYYKERSVVSIAPRWCFLCDPDSRETLSECPPAPVGEETNTLPLP